MGCLRITNALDQTKKVTITVLKSQVQLADQCRVAESFLDRFQGLIGKKTFQEGEGLLLTPCNNIHMWLMSVPIDVIFLRRINEDQKIKMVQITSLQEQLYPWRVFPVWDSRASQTLEIPIHSIQRSQVRVGDYLCID